MNTSLSYMYRDASNYKASLDVVLEGTLTDQQKDAIKAKLEDGENFIPSQVGLEDLQPRLTSFPSEDDHVWHELVGIEETEEEPTETMDAEEFHKNITAVAEWDIETAMNDLGL